MKRFVCFFSAVILASLLFLAPSAKAQGTFTAASCNYSDVNAVINGPTHLAVNGDTIQIPSGTCTWTSSLSVHASITVTGSGTPSNAANTYGAGTLNTVIVDGAGGSPLFAVQVTYVPGALFRLSTLDIEPQSGSTPLWSPVSIAGTCILTGCPNIRVDNIGFGLTTRWNENGNSSSADWMMRLDNVFGVLDHNTLPNGSNVELFNANLSSYLGVGGYGDNSWTQPDTLGGANVLYAENNVVYSNQAMDDCDTAPAGGAVGGCRIADRFNQFSFEQGAFAMSIVHGLDTDGRPRSGRQQEAYGNTVTCSISGNCNTGIVGFRGGTGIVFGNTLGGTSSYNNINSATIYRNVLNATGGWGACGGMSSYDVNDGTVYASGTLSSASGGGSNLTAIVASDTSKSWTANQWSPAGSPYTFYDVTKGFWMEIASNSANSLTTQSTIPEGPYTAATGDSYQILRATVCGDQAGRGQGGYVSGSIASPLVSLAEALDPIYEWNDKTKTSTTNFSPSLTKRLLANRDYYTDGSSGTPHAQTSPTSPFNGSSGVGFGTLANRPTSCTPRVGYFATDQGGWNQSGNAFGQGELFVCTGTNTWTLAYTPYTYPHPLVGSGGTSGGTPPNPPTNVTATAQ